MRKSVSMNDLSQYVQVQPDAHDSSNNSANLDGSTTIAADNGYASADDAVRNQSNGGRERKRDCSIVGLLKECNYACLKLQIDWCCELGFVSNSIDGGRTQAVSLRSAEARR
ncbi:hypothetical protein LXL04_033932 [Taraxacum kok-saghyz]